jgi:SAM-dependent methyltransferase
VSSFSAEWLALRDAADRRAVAPAVLTALRRWAAREYSGAPLAVTDLGAGTGSTLRRLAPILPAPQRWLLVDDDPHLLAAARSVGAAGIVVGTRVRDLAAPGVLAPLLCRADLVTASALFDLVSADWCRSLIRAAARPGRALYATLTYDGRLRFEPADPFDATLRRLVNGHQLRDKGFGPALGPAAAGTLARLATASGAVLAAARSDWRLGPADRTLLGPLVAAWAEVAAEVAAEQAPELGVAVAAWAERRLRQVRAGGLRARVGHMDLLARWQAATRPVGQPPSPLSRSQSSSTSAPSG